MQSKPPKVDDNYHWTTHVKGKMVQYSLSGSLIKRIINNPKRKEEGIAPGTVAVMQPKFNKKAEIWVMYATKNKLGGKKAIISSWRYPGISPVGKAISIPDDVMLELEKWFSK